MVINHLDISTSPLASFDLQCTRGLAVDAMGGEKTVTAGTQETDRVELQGGQNPVREGQKNFFKDTLTS